MDHTNIANHEIFTYTSITIKNNTGEQTKPTIHHSLFIQHMGFKARKENSHELPTVSHTLNVRKGEEK